LGWGKGIACGCLLTALAHVALAAPADGAAGNAGANSARLAAAPQPPGAPLQLNSINVLILALDEGDINSARLSNLTPLVHGDLKTNSQTNTQKPADTPRGVPNDNALNDIDAGRLPLPAVPPQRAIQPPAAQPPAVVIPMAPPAEDNAEQVLPLPPTPQPARDVPLAALPFWRALAQIPAIPALPSTTPTGSLSDDSTLEGPSRRPPGRAQQVAAPLRRALNAAGIRDVLTTALDGPSILRSLNSGRVTLRTIDTLRFSTGQLLDAARSGAERFTAESGVLEKMPTPASPSPMLAQARQNAIASAARIGLTLGYRAVVVLAVAPDTRGAVYSLLVIDAPREAGEAWLLHQTGTDQDVIDQQAAASTAQNLATQFRSWAPFSQTDRVAQIDKYMQLARASLQKDDLSAAQDQLQLVVAFDPSNVDAYVMLGDVLQNADSVAAAKAYQRAAEINTQNGEVWSKIAIVHTLSDPPDWIRALQAATRAQSLGFDSANLRTAMAAAEFGRAELFRRSGRIDQAEDAELFARRHLERARELAPDSPEVVASVSRLMAKYLLDQKRYKEAVQSLDLLAVQYPSDLPTQKMYARALEGYGKRDEDTFLAWARVWKLTGESEVPLDATRYAIIADGFDQRLVNIGKNVFQLSYGVSTGAILRETALLQTERAKQDVKTAVAALQIMQPPPGKASSEAHVNRLFAADLMQQAMEFYTIYLETGNDLNRTRAVEAHRSAIESLNAARGAGGGNGV
jgi:tetratricopeptide (TPR) repeat protein